jgi:hypothetical protein
MARPLMQGFHVHGTWHALDACVIGSRNPGTFSSRITVHRNRLSTCVPRWLTRSGARVGRRTPGQTVCAATACNAFHALQCAILGWTEQPFAAGKPDLQFLLSRPLSRVDHRSEKDQRSAKSNECTAAAFNNIIRSLPPITANDSRFCANPRIRARARRLCGVFTAHCETRMPDEQASS